MTNGQGYKRDPEPMNGLVSVGYNVEIWQAKKLWQVIAND